MFGIGASELVLIALIALVVVGPKNLPGALRAIGRFIGEFRRTTNSLRKEVQFDEVVEEVTRPLREGMAGIESDMRKLTRLDGGDDPEDDAAIRRRKQKLAMAAQSQEYPEGGPDDYGALPEGATVYPEASSARVETVARGTPQAVPEEGA